MKRLLITRKLYPVAKELLAKHFDVIEHIQERPMREDELKEAVKNFEVILSTFVDPFQSSVLEHADKLEVISNYAIGLDNIDVEKAATLGISVYNLLDVVTESTADLTFALFLSFIRQIPDARDYVRAGHWKEWQPFLFLGEELAGKTFVVIGYGRTGKAVAKRALGFGMRVLFYARRELEGENGVEQASLDQICEQADYVSIHLPLTSETRGMFDLALMKRMKKKPVLINVGRGAVIKSDDLAAALKEGLIRGAALDVTDPEPLPAEHPLCKISNCMIIPHLGSATKECRELMALRAAENILKHYGLHD